MNPPRRTPLNKVWGDSIKTTSPKAPDWPVNRTGDLSDVNPLKEMQAAVALHPIDKAPAEEPTVIVADVPEEVAKEELAAPSQGVRRVAYTEGRFKVARMLGPSAQIVPKISIHNFSPEW